MAEVCGKELPKMHTFLPLENVCGGMSVCLEWFSGFTRLVQHKENQSSEITFLPTAWILTLNVGLVGDVFLKGLEFPK